MRSSLIVLALLCVFAVALSGCASSSSSSGGSSVAVTVTPASASVAVNAQQQFTAKVTGTSNTAVTWSVKGGSADGTISSTGLYTAPASLPNPAQVTVTATSQASSSHSGSATVTVSSGSSGGGLTVTPSSVSLPNFGSQQFTASVSGVNWQVNGTTGGSQQFGFISSTGFYVAPSAAPTKSDGSGGSTTQGVTITVTAVSQANASQSGTATVSIDPGNQNAQSGAIELGTAGANSNDTTSNAAAHTITCCSGTLGSLITRAGSFFILSNTHVLARSDASPATGGDPIIQPASCPPSSRTVANLTSFYNLQTGAAPKIDAAIAAIASSAVDTSGNILYLGATADANGVPVPGAPHAGSGTAASVAMPVAKSGASTGLTCSTVLATNVNTSVKYNQTCGSSSTSSQFSVTYTNQVDIAGGSFSASGDSGSLIVSQSTADPVALLYAGSDTDTVGNPVSAVLNFFASGGNAATFAGGGAHAVIGCSLPAKPASVSAQSAVSVSPQSMQQAATARDTHAAELLAHPEVQAVGLGASRDNPRESAILFFVTKGQTRTNLPAQVDGIRTRIVEADLAPHRGSLTAEQSAELERTLPEPPLVYSLSAAELARAQQVHAARADEQMNLPGVQGVGITASIDAPGEAALMIFLIRGAAHNPIPPVIDGLRTRIRESSRFQAGLRDSRTAACRISATPTLKSIFRH